jgi:hypothetical protein
MLASSQMIGTRGGGPGMAHYGASHTLAHQHHLYSVQPNARCDAPSRSNPLPSPLAPAPSSASGRSWLSAHPLRLQTPALPPLSLPVRPSGSRAPSVLWGLGSTAPASGRQWAQGSVPLRRHAAAPRRPERRTPSASGPHPLVACAAAPQRQSPPPPTTGGCRNVKTASSSA